MTGWVDKGYNKLLGEVLNEWRNGFADPTTTKKTWKKLLDMDERATSLRGYVIQKFAIDKDGNP